MEKSTAQISETSTYVPLTKPVCCLQPTYIYSLPCNHHGPSPTPYIDSLIGQPSTKAAILALSAALANAVNEDQCSKCNIESVAQASAMLMKDLKKAKKSGQWTKEDKKAIRMETKGLFKEMKQAMKNIREGESLM